MGARAEEFKADSIVIKEGEMKHRMYIVLQGEVVLYQNYGTDEEYLIGVYGKGKTFGEANLFSTEPNLYTAVAYTDVKVVWFEKNNLSNFINGYPDQALKLIESILKSNISISKQLQFAINEINDLKRSKVSDTIVNIQNGSDDELTYDNIRSFVTQIDSDKEDK